MPRRNRDCPPGVAIHVIQRGNNRQICFTEEADIKAYANWLREGAEKYSIAIHAWVFMTNHVHLLMTPSDTHGISGCMQLLGRNYVRYYNYRYRRTGTLFEGRFKSCLVQAQNYLLACQRYIELNPVRAGMVKDPADYLWSSYRAHAFGQKPRAELQHVAGASRIHRAGTNQAIATVSLPKPVRRSPEPRTNYRNPPCHQHGTGAWQRSV
jgi:putative transposase